jgi:hypothetical protein
MLGHFSSEDPKPFHSSGYAQVARGGSIGSINTQTFGERTHRDRNRSSVQRYGSSMVGQGYIQRDGAPKAGEGAQVRVTPPQPTRRNMPATGNRTAVSRPQQRPAPFREPPTRYNPYG